MKRNLFVLVFSLLVLSFGLANAFDFEVKVTGGWGTGVADTINPGTAFSIDVAGTNYLADGQRSVLCDNFLFTGTGLALPIAWLDTSTFNTATFAGMGWANLFMTYAENFDGNLPDLWAVAVAAGSSGGFTTALNGVKVPMHKFGATVALAVEGVNGEICIEKGNAIDDAYDWLYDAPEPVFPKKCFVVSKAPNFAPVITEPVPLQITGPWSSTLSQNFAATDAEGDAISWTASVGTIVGANTTAAWSWKPSCQDVGQSIVLSVCAGDAMHICPAGDVHTINVVVTNDPPVIGGPCGTTTPMGAATKTAQFTVTDANDGTAAKTWEVVSVVGSRPFVGTATISATGLLTFTTTTADLDVLWAVTVKVTDCAGASDECVINYNAVGSLPYDIKIEKNHNVLQGHHSYVPVIKTAGSEDMWGFDFLIAYDASALSFMGAIPGVMFDMTGIYQWEYFTYRFGPNGNCGNACPSGMLRVVGIADQNDGLHHPLLKQVADGTVLFTLDFLVTNNRTLECQYVPIRFYWMDCGDNTIAYHKTSDANPLDIKTAVSDKVMEFWGTEIQMYNNPDGLPTYLGLPNNTAYVNCFDSAFDQQGLLKPLPERFINFTNGGIDIVCADSIDARGDINLNGVANEIADAVVFTNYFIAGLGAFTVNVEGQIAATDVNADGIGLSVADLVYLIRVVVGDALPYAKLSPYANSINVAHDGSVVSVDAELGAAYLTLAGNVEATLADGAAGMRIMTGFDGTKTRVLIYSMDKGKTFSGNILNTTGSIVSVEAADYFGSAYKVIALPTSFTVSNYPNPFNPSATIALSLPVASNWTVTIFNVAGQQVAAYSGYNEAGNVSVTWNASDQASGIYFYKAEAGKSSMTKKMVLLK
jgi:hypothetical protein